MRGFAKSRSCLLFALPQRSQTRSEPSFPETRSLGDNMIPGILALLTIAGMALIFAAWKSGIVE
jgi:hypothetical protein